MLRAEDSRSGAPLSPARFNRLHQEIIAQTWRQCYIAVWLAEDIPARLCLRKTNDFFALRFSMPRLIVCQDKQNYRVVEFEAALTLGREGDNDVILASPQVSRHHASIIRRENDEYLLFDHESTNGVWIDNDKISTISLKHGVSFRIVNYFFTFLDDQAENLPYPVFPGEDDPVAEPSQPDPATILFSPQQDKAQWQPEPPGLPFQNAAPLVEQIDHLFDDLRHIDEEKACCQHLLTGTAELLGAGRGFLALLNEKNELVYTTTYRFDPKKQSREINRQIVHATMAQASDAAATSGPAQDHCPGQICSALCAPLFRGDKPVGCLYLDQFNPTADSTSHQGILHLIALHGAAVLDNLLSRQRIQRQRASLKTRLATKDETIIRSEKMVRLYEDIRTIAPIKVPVFISGEAGSGKELVATALHRFAGRKGAYVPLNCAAIPEGIFESELFGSRKGAFHEAVDKPGKLELADGGTLFLDEVADMALVLQPKLLRFLENGEITRLGDTRVRKLDVRVVTATNRDVAALIRENSFRDDLYQRLSCFTLTVPPLRERIDDIEPLTLYFLNTFADEYNWQTPKISDGGLQILCQYHWPGNVRQLRNVLLRLAVQNQGKLITEREIAALSDEFGAMEPAALSVFPTMDEVEAAHIRAALERANGNISDAAGLVGIARSTLYQKMKKYGIAT